MPHTKEFDKMLNAMRKEYGKKHGEAIAYATAHKRHIKIDRYGQK